MITLVENKLNTLNYELYLITFSDLIFCNVAFGIGPNFYPLRLILPITLLYFSVLFFKSFFIERKVAAQPYRIIIYFIFLI